MIAPSPEPHWFKSSYSGGSGTECVECAYASPDLLIRDSKRVNGPILRVNQATWRLFIDSIRHDVYKSS
ncbi:DUF397 domain-containing protein [Streptomyces sp. NPDC006617]|uniref:DUF397 domain-containing protein n=1 Tax=Streptomyces sp. NPDC006617 TaxID=3155354 RepID=UPI0033BBDCF9